VKIQTASEHAAQAGIPVRVTFSDPRQVFAQAAPQDSSRIAPDPMWPRWYLLGLRAQSLRMPPTFDTLLAPRVLYDRVRPHPYQLHVVEQVLREKAPSAILADEVGLGKTIEAGLIYKELALRGIVRSALILAPKALLSQWREELHERFDEEFLLTDERRFRGFDAEDRVICSLPQFVRSFEKVAARPWDLLIVDEAHLLANPDSKRRKSVAHLRARWRLLLTATPVANKLTDLYSLVDLLLPGRLGTLREFEAEYVADPGMARVVRPQRVGDLRAVVRDVMCRTRRSETEINFTGRTVQTRSIPATPEEDALISDVTAYLRSLYRRLPPPSWRSSGGRTRPGNQAERGKASGRLNRGAVVREIMALQQSLSSSPRAIAESLRRRAERHADERDALLALAERCRHVESAKERLLLDVLGEIGREPALIFTLRLETAARLRETIRAHGRSADCYVGALGRAEREVMVARFNSGELDTLIATDAGAEGLNLQERCSTIFNFDLHWNPMKIEQRIGRVHRLGQSRDVAVHNFVLHDTIDDYVLRLLYQKIDLFTMTIGGLETVLAEVQEGEVDFEERILDLLLHAGDRAELSREVDALGTELAEARDRQRAAESLTAGVLG
jgi:SNF2 family DNA or RNA helicase